MASAKPKGIVDGPKAMCFAPAFKKGLEITMRTWALGTNASGKVGPDQQLEILSALHHNCVDNYKEIFTLAHEAETFEARNKRWSNFNDVLRKMIFGQYVGPSLPQYSMKLNASVGKSFLFGVFWFTIITCTSLTK